MVAGGGGGLSLIFGCYKQKWTFVEGKSSPGYWEHQAFQTQKGVTSFGFHKNFLTRMLGEERGDTIIIAGIWRCCRREDRERVLFTASHTPVSGKTRQKSAAGVRECQASDPKPRVLLLRTQRRFAVDRCRLAQRPRWVTFFPGHRFFLFLPRLLRVFANSL